MHQITLDELMKEERRTKERNLPWFLQISSAPLLKFMGEVASHPSGNGEIKQTNLNKGTLGFINGVQPGAYCDQSFSSRSKHCYVSYLDLVPMKVTEFTKEEIEMEYPKQFEFVEVMSNSKMKVIDKGYLVTLHPDKFCLKDRDQEGKILNERCYDARVHHFKGYEPKRLLVWRDGYESSAGN
ncbi:hypothetical protein J14TS2_16360 [Bacillus sp. J14TS2]|uniref:hypothetical protein n=1 Tax=Bacillus sp. J14TS2 TaxID=2807188 RepID=UPI001B282AAD|nr:hypothetical protein [Bacillus sp. J14TS2]GIN71161.1 hypothetical protein J14TS2_16360 [Bacillus sp. J14TS2]